MKHFSYERVSSPSEAAQAFERNPGARYLAGGTNLIDLMKLDIEAPEHLIDVNCIGLDGIEQTLDGGLRIGALARNSDVATDERVRRDYPVLARALVSITKQSHGRWQPAATHEVRLLLFRRSAMQQAAPRLGMCRYRRNVASPCRHRRERILYCYSPLRHGNRAARP
jgi:hypothetical protein